MTVRAGLMVVGEGSLAGVVAGSALGGWSLYLNADLSHRMYGLAAERLMRPLLPGAATGIFLSIAVAVVLKMLGRRGARVTRAAIVVLCLLAFIILLAAGFPYREQAFPLHWYSSKLLSLSVLTMVGMAGCYLLACRILDTREMLRPGSGPSDAWRWVGSLRSGAAATGLGILSLAGAGWFALPSILASHSAGRLSVILVSIDTLRADRLGVLGNPRRLTPKLDSLAREGMVFEQATSAAPWTLPAHVSLFTSLLPFDHGVRWENQRIVPSRPLVTEHFRDAGFRTAAFTAGGYVHRWYGFDQGFEVYEDHDYLLEKGPEGIAAAALAWVRRVGTSPFFLFVHTYEPHLPYTRTEIARPADAGRLPRIFGFKELEAVQSGRLTLTEPERRYITDLYDGDVAYADTIIGGFLQTLQHEGILDRAVLVVLSDHGEELWEHYPTRSPDHGHSLYQELIHIPLLVRAPGVVPSGVRIRTPVSLLDVAPTLLSLSGLPPDPTYRGRDLSETVRTGAEPPVRPIFTEDVEYGPGRFSLRRGHLKIILTPQPEQFLGGVELKVPPLEVFNLASDPLEQRDLSANPDEPVREMVRSLGARIAERLSAQTKMRGQEGELPEDLLRRLRALGYIR